EPNARFSGTLQATEIIIAGRVMGTVIGTQRVHVTATGKVAGTIASRDLQADPAALIDGEVNILHPDGSISTMTTGADRAPPKYRPGE
ncbi:MAG: polymer-forming cytoskeletal protein, partial [Phycisphaerales bacterium]|nr:polymer-forming cytoskeletal protein [Phycisphaerales bacterium]